MLRILVNRAIGENTNEDKTNFLTLPETRKLFIILGILLFQLSEADLFYLMKTIWEVVYSSTYYNGKLQI